MDETLRLYFDSIIRIANKTDPSIMTDTQLIGVIGLMPKPEMTYSEWCNKIGLDQEPVSKELTQEEAGLINDAAIHADELRELERNG